MKIFEKWPFISSAVICLLIIFLLELAFKQKPVPDFTTVKSITEKKEKFFNYAFSELEPVNDEIREIRIKLKNLKTSNIGFKERRFINKIAYYYGVEELSSSQNEDEIQMVLDKLLLKVDVIPPALILAQAANESAWGTSRFARQANNYFGIWCFSKGCGLVPKSRNEGQRHEVRRFKSMRDSIRYYVHLLNSHRSYKTLRNERAKKRHNGGIPEALDLVSGLTSYSERGEDYVKEISAMINYNKLSSKYPPIEVD